jgi:predicted nucleic-acid-binding Zn-ribbon protein
MSEVKKCPKCGGEMVEGEFLKNIPKVTSFPKKGRSWDRVIPTYCKNCGFIEIYKEMKKKGN